MRVKLSVRRIGILGVTAVVAVAVAAPALAITINGTLASGSPDWPFTTGLQTLRVTRNAVASTCASPKAYPGPFGSGTYHYDAYVFLSNSASTSCVTVTASSTATAVPLVFPVTYLPIFDPANIGTNYLADPGTSPQSGTPQTYSFNVPANGRFVIVVSAAPSDGTGVPYTLDITGFSGGPTAVISSRRASATRTGSGILVRWRTGVETGILGFNIYRLVDGKATKVNRSLITAAFAGSPHGASHAWLDRNAPHTGRVTYRIQAVTIDGRTIFLDRVNLR